MIHLVNKNKLKHTFNIILSANRYRYIDFYDLCVRMTDIKI